MQLPVLLVERLPDQQLIVNKMENTMEILKKKPYAIVPQYFVWTFLVARVHELSGTKLKMFYAGNAIVMSLLGIGLAQALSSLDSKKDKGLVITLVLAMIGLAFLF